MEELDTPRLVLAPLSEDDASRLYEYRSDPAVSRFQPFQPASVDDARRFIASGLGLDPGGWHQLAIRLRSSGLLVGDIGYRFTARGQAEIGVTVAADQQGRGIATEAVVAVLDDLFGSCGARRVVASVDPRNSASLKLFKRVGMRQEAHFRRSMWFKGEWVDDVVFAVLGSDRTTGTGAARANEGESADQAAELGGGDLASGQNLSLAGQCGRLSQWSDTAALDPLKAAKLADQLERRAHIEDEVGARNEYVRLLGVSAGMHVLDVGCGTGVVTRAVAELVGPMGTAVGVDASGELLRVARRLADDAGLGERVDFRQEDCRSLPFADESFDVAVAVTVLSHVPDAWRALAEMVRVTRVGGRVGVFDIDADALIIAHPDRALTRRIVAAEADHALVNGWLMRELPGRLAALGVDQVRARAFMPLERAPDGFYAGVARRAAEVALEAGVITRAEQVRWLDELGAEFAAGRFLGGWLQLFVWGTRQPS